MTSPITRTAAVLSVGVAALISLFPMRTASVALADVHEAVQAQESVFATGKRTLHFSRKPASGAVASYSRTV